MMGGYNSMCGREGEDDGSIGIKSEKRGET